jgi:hypothetical protein
MFSTCLQDLMPNSMGDEMDEKSRGAKKLKKLYTFNVSFSFEMQFTFTASEVQPAKEGGESDFDPSDEAIAALEKEIEEYLSQQYPVTNVEAFTDFNSLLGVMNDSDKH